MSTIAENLAALQQAKADIASAITTKGGTVNSGDGFSDFAADIATIPTGQTPTLVTKSITENGTYTAASDNADGYSEVTVNVPVPVVVEPNDVNLYDYDGTLLHSFTAAQFLALSSLPAVPSHANTANGTWNYTLADAKAHVTLYDELDIGAIYTADTQQTKVLIHLDEGSGLTVTVNGSSTYDWGDGTSSASPHTYSDYDDYWITGAFSSSKYITASGGLRLAKVRLEGKNEYVNDGFGSNYTSNLESYALGKGTGMTALGCQNAYMLKAIMFPSGYTNTGNTTFSSCFSLRVVSLPKSITMIQANSFQNCRTLQRITLPQNLQSIEASAFTNCGFAEIKIPSTVTTIKTSFGGCVKLRLVKLYSATPPTLTSADGFPAWTKFEIPAGSLATYESTSNWLSYAGRYIERSV